MESEILRQLDADRRQEEQSMLRAVNWQQKNGPTLVPPVVLKSKIPPERRDQLMMDSAQKSSTIAPREQEGLHVAAVQVWS